MKKIFSFTFDLLYCFIISLSQAGWLEIQMFRTTLVRVFHPFLLCEESLFLIRDIYSSGCFPKFLITPLKYPILLFVRKTPC
ncbi:hypothetical protein BA915_08380 [Helicobacter pullorum]|nr:hypothetical protein HPU229254_04380 [Helicobacter pullorum]OCR13721.1 hypothetical protein BA915_08380 [Helicobacter pullorum]